MPNVFFKGNIIECPNGALLKDVLEENGVSPHNDASRFLNCRGLGTCGTCTVKITGKVHPHTRVEKIRLNIPPHHFDDGLRLACQVIVEADLHILKWEGFWGQENPDNRANGL